MRYNTENSPIFPQDLKLKNGLFDKTSIHFMPALWYNIHLHQSLAKETFTDVKQAITQNSIIINDGTVS